MDKQAEREGEALKLSFKSLKTRSKKTRQDLRGEYKEPTVWMEDLLFKHNVLDGRPTR